MKKHNYQYIKGSLPTIAEVENENALAAVSYPLALAGVSIHRVPLLEVKPGKSVEIEKKLRG